MGEDWKMVAAMLDSGCEVCDELQAGLLWAVATRLKATSGDERAGLVRLMLKMESAGWIDLAPLRIADGT